MFADAIDSASALLVPWAGPTLGAVAGSHMADGWRA